jgi:hypothetical protein
MTVSEKMQRMQEVIGRKLRNEISQDEMRRLITLVNLEYEVANQNKISAVRS